MWNRTPIKESERRIDRAIDALTGTPSSRTDDEDGAVLYAIDEHAYPLAKLVLIEGATLADAEGYVASGRVPGAKKVTTESAVNDPHKRLVEVFKEWGHSDVSANAAAGPDDMPVRYVVPAQPGSTTTNRLTESAGRLALGPLARNPGARSLDSLNVPDGAVIEFNENDGIRSVNGKAV